MRIRRVASSAAFAAGLAVLPLSTAKAQYYNNPCWFPLFWPVCAAGVVVGTAATIVTAPVRVLAGPPPYYYRYRYYGPPYYPPRAYYAPRYYPPPYYYGYYGPR